MRSRSTMVALTLVAFLLGAGVTRALERAAGGSSPRSTASASDRQEGRLIEMEHYSFSVPSGEWSVEKLAGPSEQVVLEKELGDPDDPTRLLIRVLRGTITQRSYLKKTARWHAENLFKIERKTMQEKGVEKGLYQLLGVSMGEDDVAGKHFFFMNYRAETVTDVQPSSLYLYFPRDRNNEWFLMLNYRQAVPRTTSLQEPAKASLLELLGTLEIRSDGSAPPSAPTVASVPAPAPYEREAGEGFELTGRWRSMGGNTIEILQAVNLVSGKTELDAEKVRAGFSYSFEVERQEDGSFVGVARAEWPCEYPDTRGRGQTTPCSVESPATLRVVTPSRIEFEYLNTLPRSPKPRDVRRFCESNCTEGTTRRQSASWVRQDVDQHEVTDNN